MKTILILIQKEFLQIFRNRSMLPLIFMMPVIQLIILGNAATFELKNINLQIVDEDLSPSSRRLGEKFNHSPFFNVSAYSLDRKQCEEALTSGAADAYIIIPSGFEKESINGESTKIQLVINSINSSAAGLISAYCNNIIREFGQNTKIDLKQNFSTINITYSYWYNPEMKYPSFMVPGILTLLVTLIGLFLSSMNIVREKEIGTIEQINITPIKKYQFITGKLTPFWIIAQLELALGLFIGWVIYRIPLEGSLLLLFAFSGLYLIVILSLGLLVSTVNNTQQQAMFVAWFFMVLFIIMSGLFTPVDSMPFWAQKLNTINPIKYFIEFIRMVLLKGSGFKETAHLFRAMTIFAIILLPISIWKYKKTN